MQPAPPVFVLASPHSEVSRISAMLGQHPGIYAVPELNLFAADRLVDVLDALPTFRVQGLVRAVAQLYCGEQTLETAETAHRWMYRRMQSATAEVHRELWQKVSPLLLLDPSGAHTDVHRDNDLARIHAAYPDARFLHLVRHPRTQAEAWLRSPLAFGQLFAIDAVDRGGREIIADPQIDWHRRQTGILQFLATIPEDRQLRMRAEDILGDPRCGLQQITHWLALDWSADIHQAMLHPERGPYSRAGPYGAEAGSDIGFLVSPELQPQPADTASLKGALPWRADGGGFSPEVIEIAEGFGYG